MNILQTSVSYYKDIKDASSQVTVILYDYLTTPIPSAENQLQIVRTSTDPKELTAAKSKLPYITPSGTFSYRNDTSLIIPSGLIQIDMDRKDNTGHPDWESIPHVLKDNPHVAYIGRSASGRSYWGLIPIAYPDKLPEHWEAINHHFTVSYGINLDSCTKAISQPRFYAYDPDAYINPEAMTFSKVLSPQHTALKTKPTFNPVPEVHDRIRFERYVQSVCESKVDITGDRRQWIRVGEAIKSELGDEGLDTFIDICKFSPLFDEDECRKAYRSMKPHSVTIGTFYFLCHEHGIRPDDDGRRIRVHRPMKKPIIEREDHKPPAAPKLIMTWEQLAKKWLNETPEQTASPSPEVSQDMTLNDYGEAMQSSIKTPEGWDERIKVVQTFFKGYVHDGSDIQLYPHLKIGEVPTFIQASLNIIESCPHSRTYEPYLIRLEQVMGLLQSLTQRTEKPA